MWWFLIDYLSLEKVSNTLTATERQTRTDIEPENVKPTLQNDLHLKDIIIASGGSRIFPRGGREPSRGGVNTPNFPENCMKSKEFGRPGGGRASLTPPLDPPMIAFFKFLVTVQSFYGNVNGVI